MLMLSTVFHTLLGEYRRNRQAKLRIIVGACEEDKYEGWIATSKARLDLLREADWANLENSVDAILAEHVWEHLDCNAAIVAAQNCFKSLKPGGYIRVDQEWTPADGMITRSARFDSRNFTGELAYTSIIMDARRPARESRVASQLDQPHRRERELIGRDAAQ